MDVNYWNKIIYKNDDDSWANDNKITADEFWDKFQVRSWPKFRDGCACEVPSKWSDDVRVMLTKMRDELGDRIDIRQIKEKWCTLTVYYSGDEVAEARMQELIRECVEQLQIKRVYPITLDDYTKLIERNKEKDNG